MSRSNSPSNRRIRKVRRRVRRIRNGKQYADELAIARLMSLDALWLECRKHSHTAHGTTPARRLAFNDEYRRRVNLPLEDLLP